MGRGYAGLILMLIDIWFFIVLVSQNIYAYPYRVNRNERSAVQFSDVFTDFERKSSDLGEYNDNVSENGEQFSLYRRVYRDTSRYQDTHMANISLKTRARVSMNHREGLFSQTTTESDARIVFPGEINLVPRCKGVTYCEKVDSYPEDMVNRAIQRNESIKYLASIDMIGNVSSIEERIGQMDDIPLCMSTEQVVFPQSAKNKDNEWKFVANQDNFKQGIRIEKCRKESTSCSAIGGLAEGYKTSCKQKYIYRQLASVLTDGTIIPDTFPFPSSCCCHVSFNGSPLTRMGVNIVEQRSQVTPIKTRRRK